MNDNPPNAPEALPATTATAALAATAPAALETPTLPRLPAISPASAASVPAATPASRSAPMMAQLRPDSKRSVTIALTLLVAIVLFAPLQPGMSDELRAATQARANQRYDLALADYAQASQIFPAAPQPHCASGDVYMAQGLPSQAAGAYRACASLAPADGAAWLDQGDALAQTGNASGATAAWQRAGAAGDADGYARLAERAEGLGQLDVATRWWSLLPQTNLLAQERLGLLALAQGNVSLARAHFFAVLATQSTYAAQLRQAGAPLLAAFPPATALDQQNIGIALLTLGEPGVALTPLRRATQLDPHDGAAHAYYGWTLWLLGQRNAAQPEIAAGLRYSPGLPFARYAAGELALSDGRPAEALADFQTALEVASNNPALWSAAGDAALAEQDFVTAELSYGNAAQDSNDPAYAVALVRFYFTHGLGLDGGGNGQALQIAFNESRRFPTSEPLIFLEGQIYDSLGQQTNAYYLFQQAVGMAPTDPGPWYYLGQYAAADGDTVPAVEDLRTALALQPQGPYAAQARQALARLPSGGL